MKNKNTQEIISTKHSIKTDYRLSLQNALQTSLHRLNNKDSYKERQSIQTDYTTKHSRQSVEKILSKFVKNSNVHYVNAKEARKKDEFLYKQKRVFSKIAKAWSTDAVKDFHRQFYKAPDFEQRSAINELHKRYFE
tara:strand:- start:2623 stop:3030 length:408 start_codon:yes stop_codon:yes gene_type:complete